MSTDADYPTQYMLTTVDNPFDPFEQWNEWLAFDTRLGYDTPGILARTVNNSNDLSDPDQAMALGNAIDQIVSENVSGMHRKVSKNYLENL
jgi:hypothetical protein